MEMSPEHMVRLEVGIEMTPKKETPMRHMLATLALTLPLPLFAQDPTTVGTMNGTMNGIDVSYIITDNEGADTFWEETDKGIEVLFTAYPSDSPMGDADVITLKFAAETANRTPTLLRSEMTLSRGEETLTAADTAIDLDLESLEVSGDSLLLIGNVRATLSPSGENVSILAEQAQNLTADIQATIIRDEGS